MAPRGRAVSASGKVAVGFNAAAVVAGAAEGVHIWGGSGQKDNYIHTHSLAPRFFLALHH